MSKIREILVAAKPAIHLEDGKAVLRVDAGLATLALRGQLVEYLRANPKVASRVQKGALGILSLFSDTDDTE